MHSCLRFLLLLFGLVAALYVTGKVNKTLQDSFTIKENLSQFDEIRYKIENCWTNILRTYLYISCLSRDELSFHEISFVLTSCYLQDQELPPIQCNKMTRFFCKTPSCPYTCGTDFSEKFKKKLGFNVFQVILSGVEHKLCLNTDQLSDDENWRIGMPWNQIMMTLSKTKGYALTDTQTTYKEKIQLLKNLLRTSLHEKELKFLEKKETII